MISHQGPVLFCTVGGSHEPIIKAIETVKPGFVYFFCTNRDPETDKPGSLEQITGKGNVIKAKPNDQQQTLCNIPSQIELDAERFDTRIVPADEFDGAVIAMRDVFKEVADKFPSHTQFIADYTGGTKTMSAALVCVALEWEEPKLRLQLVSGPRPDLQTVKQGAEQVVGASISRMRFDRLLKLQLGAWQNFAYHQAECGLRDVSLTADSPDRIRRNIACMLSRAFSRWDVFDHAGALESLKDYKNRIGKVWGETLLRDLSLLRKDGDKRQTPLRIYDLWRNAERRASQGRFDDAAARLYRLIEWTAQWQLKVKRDWDTADFPRDQLPPNLSSKWGPNRKIQLGLRDSWEVVAEKLGEPASKVVAGSAGRELCDLLKIRNLSILAHGESPVQEADWERMRKWMDANFFPVFEQLASEVGLKEMPDQLPKELPESVLRDLNSA